MICLTADLMVGQPVDVRYIRQTYGVSKATATRDITRLRKNMKTSRTYTRTKSVRRCSTRAA